MFLPMRMQRPRTGFTLAEMAIVVLIIGIAMTMGLKMVTATLENTAYSETQSKQERIKLALIGFMRTNGRLPCPDSAAGVPTGAEAATCATAVTAYGVVPWQTLGLPREATQDGWGNFFTYRVANFANATLVAAGPATPPLHPRINQNWAVRTGFDIVSYANAATTPGYQSLLINTSGGVAEARNVVAVILSHGKNGLGAKTVASPTRIAIAGAGADETTNATAATTTFVRRPVTDSTAAPGGAYDDLLMPLTPQDLLQPLMNEKTLLGVCQAYCAAPGAGCTTTVAIPVGNSPLTCP